MDPVRRRPTGAAHRQPVTRALAVSRCGFAPVVTVDHDALSGNGYDNNTLPRVLLLFHHNAAGARFDVVKLAQEGPDTDNDGMPDNWEKLHFPGLSVADADSDFDDDGFPDVSEHHAGTDPRDSNSSLRFETPIDVKNETVLLRWQSVPGRRYRVEKATATLPSGSRSPRA